MNKNKKVAIVSLIFTALLFVLGFSFLKTTPSSQVETATGAVSSPDILSPYISVGGMKEFSQNRSFATATNTPCAIQSPAATSTLKVAQAMITVASSTATTWRLSTSTTPYATTTSYDYFALASGVQGSFTLNGSTSTTATYMIVPPNTWFVWSVEGTAIGDATKLLGFCDAKFTVFQ